MNRTTSEKSRPCLGTTDGGHERQVPRIRIRIRASDGLHSLGLFLNLIEAVVYPPSPFTTPVTDTELDLNIVRASDNAR